MARAHLAVTQAELGLAVAEVLARHNVPSHWDIDANTGAINARSSPVPPGVTAPNGAPPPRFEGVLDEEPPTRPANGVIDFAEINAKRHRVNDGKHNFVDGVCTLCGEAASRD
jgi:hypothetical protein